mmetsp:Transcript_2419/g.8559  ORF Transcript_2419/g.8559 Transcript_2419/m.8559 type:complete len:236 (-) Transcript_2419:1096-1803(-)
MEGLTQRASAEETATPGTTWSPKRHAGSSPPSARCLPLTSTRVPPKVVPELGATALSCGIVVYCSATCAVTSSPCSSTAMGTTPAAPAGLTHSSQLSPRLSGGYELPPKLHCALGPKLRPPRRTTDPPLTATTVFIAPSSTGRARTKIIASERQKSGREFVESTVDGPEARAGSTTWALALPSHTAASGPTVPTRKARPGLSSNGPPFMVITVPPLVEPSAGDTECTYAFVSVKM